MKKYEKSQHLPFTPLDPLTKNLNEHCKKTLVSFQRLFRTVGKSESVELRDFRFLYRESMHRKSKK